MVFGGNGGDQSLPTGYKGGMMKGGGGGGRALLGSVRLSLYRDLTKILDPTPSLRIIISPLCAH